MSTELIALMIAFVAVFFGPIVQLFIAKLQIRVATRSTSRQAWINALRDEISLFLRFVSEVDFMVTVREEDLPEDAEKQIDKQMQHLFFHYHKILLYLNPLDTTHSKLSDKMKETGHTLWDKELNSVEKAKEIDKHKYEIIEISRRVFKKEWERVKQGE